MKEAEKTYLTALETCKGWPKKPAPTCRTRRRFVIIWAFCIMLPAGMEEAEKMHLAALATRKALAEKNPAAYLRMWQ
jgi:hypothetical protein